MGEPQVTIGFSWQLCGTDSFFSELVSVVMKKERMDAARRGWWLGMVVERRFFSCFE